MTMPVVLLVFAVIGGSISTHSCGDQDQSQDSSVLADECELLQVSTRLQAWRKPKPHDQPVGMEQARESLPKTNIRVGHGEAAVAELAGKTSQNNNGRVAHGHPAGPELVQKPSQNNSSRALHVQPALPELAPSPCWTNNSRMEVQAVRALSGKSDKLMATEVATKKRQRHQRQKRAVPQDEDPLAVAEAHPPPDTDEFRSRDIWNASDDWITIRTWHPAGVISNLKGGKIVWAEASFVNLEALLFISAVAYPAIFLGILYALVITVALALGPRPHCDAERMRCRCYLPGMDDDDIFWSEDGIQRQTSNGSSPEDKVATVSNQDSQQHNPTAIDETLESKEGVLIYTGNKPPAQLLPFSHDYAPPILAREDLTVFSQLLYSIWAYFCCTIPCCMVFGLPTLLTIMTISFPQEVFSILSILVAALVFSNGVYMTIFATSASLRMHEALRTGDDSTSRSCRAPSAPPSLQWLWPEEVLSSEEASGPSESALKTVHHWVLLPQYNEDIECVSMALKSISENTYARTNISVLLAMEEREVGAQEKAEKLRDEYLSLFEEVCITYHPANLPNDPPGKASNLKWAADCLLEHLWRTRTDLARIIVTVADADSEFHHKYFDILSSKYLEVPPEMRNLRIWQSPICHLKNYFRQPSPVIVGTMFTTMQELSIMADPNGISFPYSTYSLSLELIRRVGGWDAEWIAEDWHMGIKCYLLTVGLVCVEPIMLPTVNYTPEDNTWYKSCNARWAQAKRHALGFSDLSYYFMMLPLIFAHALSNSTGKTARIKHLRAFWGMAFNGVTWLIRLVNVHVVIGVMANYGVLNVVLRAFMYFFMSPERHISLIWERTDFCISGMMTASVFFMITVTVQFQFIFRMTKHRIDELPESYGPWSRWLFQNDLAHWIYTMTAFLAFGPFYFFLLGIAAWRAAIKMIVSPVFEYEVASKPKPVPRSKPFKRDDQI